jgi:short-subunit dehydrogenase involved in D-alanine esterification of teichoic acids
MNIFSQALRNQLKSTQVTLFQAFIPLVDTPMTAGRGTGKLSASQAARKILDGIERNKLDNDIGKTKVLRTLNRFIPAVARSLMARS